VPLFTAADAEHALSLVHAHAYGEDFPVGADATVRLRRAGHILGAAIVDARIAGTKLVFSGDLGRWDRPILHDPEPVTSADVVLVESTYGDRLHAGDAETELARVVHEAVARGGALLVPAFAVGRAQELLYTLRALEDAGRIPILPVFLDSPMAIDVTEIYRSHAEDHDLEMALLTDTKRRPLSPRELRVVRTAQESKALNDRRGPLIVVSASGMATGGRILHHLKARLADPETTVLLTGFQAADTRGRKLLDGARELRIHGRSVPVRAAVVNLDGLSAHADRNELLRWLAGFERAPRRVYVVHGEPGAAQSLAAAIGSRFGWTVTVAEDGATVPLDA
jgi:metallo-beta-lactamase family protein